MRKFYLSTALPYVNLSPHLGFALEVVQADVIARYHRLLGEDVFFLTGTDEHGAKVAKAAEKAGKKPEEFCDEISEKFKELARVLDISNNDFIRTTDRKRHWSAVKKVWLKLKESGALYKKKYKGIYCLGCEAFITQKDLRDGKCIIHQREPEVVEEENYFFRLSRYSKDIQNIIEKDQIRIIPRTRKNEMMNFVKQGLEDVSFSRPRKDSNWGIPAPDDDSQTIYVWADALINYISALGYDKGENFKEYWPADIHCIGKDIQKFHCLIWPGMLLSLGLSLPKMMFVHGFITVGGEKMSKSLGNIIDPIELARKYGVDAVRYFLLREIPPTEDGDYTEEKFEQRYNADLAGGLGNLVARVITLAEKSKIKYQISKIPQVAEQSSLRGRQIKNQKFIDKIWQDYKKALEEFKFNEALIAVWELIGFCDKYIEKEQPWRLLSNPKSKIQNPKLKEVIGNLLFAISNIAEMLQSFLPETSEKIFKQLGLKSTNKKPLKFRVKKGKPLFPRVAPH